MHPTQLFVIIIDEHFLPLVPFLASLPLWQESDYQSLSVLLGTLDSTRRLLQYHNPLSWSPLGMLDYARISLEPTWTAHGITFNASSKGLGPLSYEPYESWDVALYKKKQEVNTYLVGFGSPPRNHVGHLALSCQSSCHTPKFQFWDVTRKH
jgi:hypothetical protein